MVLFVDYSTASLGGEYVYMRGASSSPYPLVRGLESGNEMLYPCLARAVM